MGHFVLHADCRMQVVTMAGLRTNGGLGWKLSVGHDLAEVESRCNSTGEIQGPQKAIIFTREAFPLVHPSKKAK